MARVCWCWPSLNRNLPTILHNQYYAYFLIEQYHWSITCVQGYINVFFCKSLNPLHCFSTVLVTFRPHSVCLCARKGWEVLAWNINIEIMAYDSPKKILCLGFLTVYNLLWMLICSRLNLLNHIWAGWWSPSTNLSMVGWWAGKAPTFGWSLLLQWMNLQIAASICEIHIIN